MGFTQIHISDEQTKRHRSFVDGDAAAIKTPLEAKELAKLCSAPELLAREFKNELGVDINPQALRMFIRSRWHRVSPLAHAIKDGE